MAGNNVEFSGDVENGYGGNRIQPFASTPKPEEGDQKKQQHPITLKTILGFEEICSVDVWRASVAELLGTAALVFALDTIVISSIQTETKTPNLVMSTLVAIIITILLLATFPISGGHINPIVSFSAVLTGLISITRAVIYILAQCVGGIVGALALKAVVSSRIEQTFSLGGCTLNVVAPGPDGPVVIGLETGQALWLEIICSFIFLFASVWMAFDGRQAKALGRVTICIIIGIVLGLLVFVSTTVTAQKGYAGAGLNPARCLGPALIRGGHLWDGHWVFWVGPAIACVAFGLYTKVIPSQHFHSY
ncbi:Aquaporin (Major intrinsic protein family) [Melia azedarach]|uniref:Aquaporin (Major intrinsic protein family) n=1 Tax=Melia azedarach TaxID=155640 RepID=A0ACC1XZ18_MELAZ|nr:Aquaporin (Major intrinsic protein family) [Melia azedarach]